MGVNKMRIKILPLLCRLGLVLRLGSVLFDLLVVSVKCRHLPCHEVLTMGPSRRVKKTLPPRDHSARDRE